MLDWELGLGAKGRAGPTVGAGAAVAEKADARPMPAAPAPVRRARREARRGDGLRSSEAGSVMAFLSWGTLLVECSWSLSDRIDHDRATTGCGQAPARGTGERAVPAGCWRSQLSSRMLAPGAEPRATKQSSTRPPARRAAAMDSA